jgi:hypothetical protein
VTLVQSCGVPELDALFISHARNEMRFSPAFKDGKPIDSIFPCEFSF